MRYAVKHEIFCIVHNEFKNLIINEMEGVYFYICPETDVYICPEIKRCNTCAKILNMVI